MLKTQFHESGNKIEEKWDDKKLLWEGMDNLIPSIQLFFKDGISKIKINN